MLWKRKRIPTELEQVGLTAIVLTLQAWAEQKRRMDRMQEVAQTPKNWLPNFGRVWTEGPRSTTAHEYRYEVTYNQTEIDICRNLMKISIESASWQRKMILILYKNIIGKDTTYHPYCITEAAINDARSN